MGELQHEGNLVKMKESIDEKETLISNMRIELEDIKATMAKKINAFNEIEVELQMKLELIMEEKSELEIIVENKQKEVETIMSKYDVNIESYEKEKISFV